MKKSMAALVAITALSTNPAAAKDLSIKVTNLTNGIHFTPLLVAAHDNNNHMFMEGSAASASLQAMAEGGDISGLSTDIQSIGGNVVENPAGGLLAPGAYTEFNLMNDSGNTHLSLSAMLLPTNDGFVGADSIKIPDDKGTYTFYLNAYDAGTEANDELITGGGAPGVAGIPADPSGNSGTGGTGVATTDNNTTIHIHRGNLGDSDATGGTSDLSNTVHRWLNPVAELVITVK